MKSQRKIVDRRPAKLVSGLALTLTVALVAGCGSGLSSGSFPTGACGSNALAIQDLAGQCRTMPTTMGALEAAG